MKLTLMQEKILNTAESLIQKMGYNGFSYKDIALIVGIKTSSIHYYYPTKEDLAAAVIDWQLERLLIVLNELKCNATLSLQGKLLHVVDIILSLTLHDEMKMCLGGILASDVLSLSEKLKNKVRHFFSVLEKWIKELLDIENYTHNPVEPLHSKDNLPKYLLIHIEGGLLMSRLYHDFSYIEIVKQFIKKIS
ncbi:TetR/AcrR family transcriptional regulator [Legionella longbeachae]|uniref:Putative transcriptional regulator, TetR family n=1 Tax=Legionella longbeachae serogroup 1 (strain NSW150) TaxID=661367 RepID=D3HL07_LEGLN|nr:TetR/AcrR family transcriptional regulator [Legionella longbeachae]VEE03634.1 TetR family transcriptional regulator [Legionella oakridgensis]HBD7397560.1 TetR/AcrR family transcriptional regulator [Legionella pneumophila]ARB93481.1 TetR/AcrR family transcriptional regulator [Legionella longbeachae]ARM33414.1 TetR/AcrR family transcriptional regulator [Legionella longbeachae]QIN33334.1 TetR family transcriptional regulator [Legionella longbeachae]